MGQVVEKYLSELSGQLKAQGVTLDVRAEVCTWLCHKGYDPQMGARPLARVIEDELKKPLADALLFGDLKGGGHAVFELHRGKPQLMTSLFHQRS